MTRARVRRLLVASWLVGLVGGLLASPAAAQTPEESSMTDTSAQVLIRVAPGDTLGSIAGDYGITLQALLGLNPSFANPDLIHPGDPVLIRGAQNLPATEPTAFPLYEVRRGDTLRSIARRSGTSLRKLIEFNPRQNIDLIYPGEILRLDPMPGAQCSLAPAGAVECVPGEDNSIPRP